MTTARYSLPELVREYRLACVRQRGEGCACAGCALLRGPRETLVMAVVRAYEEAHAVPGRCLGGVCLLCADARDLERRYSRPRSTLAGFGSEGNS